MTKSVSEEAKQIAEELYQPNIGKTRMGQAVQRAMDMAREEGRRAERKEIEEMVKAEQGTFPYLSGANRILENIQARNNHET